MGFSESPELIVLLDALATGVALTSVLCGDVVAMSARDDVDLVRRTRLQKQVFWHVGNSSLSKFRVVSVCASFGVGVGRNEVSYRGVASVPDFNLSKTSVTDTAETWLGALLKEEDMIGVCVGESALIFGVVKSITDTSCVGVCVGESALLFRVVKSATETLAFRDEQQLDARSGVAAIDEGVVSAFLVAVFWTVTNRRVLDGT